MMKRTRTGFDTSLTWISLAGFAAIITSSFNVFNLGPWMTSIILAIAGLGLLEEGRAREFWRWGRDGITGIEYAYILTILIGFTSIIMALLTLPFIDVTGPMVNVFTGFIALFAVIIILIQKFGQKT